ncbi:hypothetical protein D9M70_523120 [compost metagenome]
MATHKISADSYIQSFCVDLIRQLLKVVSKIEVHERNLVSSCSHIRPIEVIEAVVTDLNLESSRYSGIGTMHYLKQLVCCVVFANPNYIALGVRWVVFACVTSLGGAESRANRFEFVKSMVWPISLASNHAPSAV